MHQLLNNTRMRSSLRITALLSLPALAGILAWQVLPAGSVNAAGTTDLPSSIIGSPAAYQNLITANANTTGAFGTLGTASSSLSDTLNVFNAMQSGVLSMAMDQGASGSGITFDRLTNASTIVPSDAQKLVSASLSELAVSGIIVPQTLNSSALLTQDDTDILALAAMRDLGLKPEELKKGIAMKTVLSGDTTTVQPMPMDVVFDIYWSILDAVGAEIRSIPGTVTLNTAKLAVARAFIKVNATVGLPDICPVNPPINWSPDGPGFLCPTFSYSETELAGWFNTNFDPTYAAVTNTALKNKVVADILGTSGLFTLAEYKQVFANTVASVAGLSNQSSIMAAIGSGSAASFTDAVKGAIQNQILEKIAVSQSLITPSSIQGAVRTALSNVSDPKVQELRAFAQQAVDASLKSGSVDLTQLTNLSQLQSADVQKILDAALKDANITTLTPTQLLNLQTNVLREFSLQQGKIDVAGVQKLLATEINTALGGTMNVTALVSQFSSGSMVSQLENATRNAMINNVMQQVGSATALLDSANLQNVISSSILSTTGVGDLKNIQNAISSLGPMALNQFKGNLENIVNGQISQLTNKMAQQLSPENIEKLIATQLTSLTGLGNIASVQSLINNSVGQALSSLTQIGAQINSIDKALSSALGSLTTGLNSLTGTFNGTLSSLTSLAQLNLSNLTGNITGLVGNLTSQITGPISSAISSITGSVSNILGGGIASAADLSSLTSSLGNLSGGLGSALSGAGGIASLASGIPGVSGLSQKPFGGRITKALYCTCSPGDVLLTVGGIPGYDGIFLYKAGMSILYPMYQIYRSGPNTLGLASQTGFAPCMMYVGFGCAPKGAGMPIFQIGTSR